MANTYILATTENSGDLLFKPVEKKRKSDDIEFFTEELNTKKQKLEKDRTVCKAYNQDYANACNNMNTNKKIYNDLYQKIYNLSVINDLEYSEDERSLTLQEVLDIEKKLQEKNQKIQNAFSIVNELKIFYPTLEESRKQHHQLWKRNRHMNKLSDSSNVLEEEIAKDQSALERFEASRKRNTSIEETLSK